MENNEIVTQALSTPANSSASIDSDWFWEQLKTVLDPDVNVNVVDLGLIYGIDVETCTAGRKPSHRVSIRMTLTSPTCPLGDYLLTEVKRCIENHPAVSEAQVELVWEPPWHKDMITEAGRMELGWL